MKKCFHSEKHKRFQASRARAQLRRKRTLKARNARALTSLATPEALRIALRDPRIKMNKPRRRFLKTFYAPRDYNHGPRQVDVVGNIGLENDIVAFLDFTQSVLDSYSGRTNFNFAGAKRLWPSTILLFVSHVHWIGLTKTADVLISSTEPEDPGVSCYLAHCGFYKYVGRHRPVEPTTVYSETDVVKIRREEGGKNSKARHFELTEMVQRHSTLSPDEIERFHNVVLTEIFSNVTEHGIAQLSPGWFVLGQYHPTTKIISICIADNGIGIRNSLLTGPQASEIRRHTKTEELASDSKMIQNALELYISGAMDAEPPETSFWGNPRLPSGKGRGRGLKKIVSNCQKIGAKLTVLSQNGCISLDQNGNPQIARDTKKRCFAGTLYHIILPAKGPTQ